MTDPSDHVVESPIGVFCLEPTLRLGLTADDSIRTPYSKALISMRSDLSMSLQDLPPSIVTADPLKAGSLAKDEPVVGVFGCWLVQAARAVILPESVTSSSAFINVKARARSTWVPTRDLIDRCRRAQIVVDVDCGREGWM